VRWLGPSALALILACGSANRDPAAEAARREALRVGLMDRLGAEYGQPVELPPGMEREGEEIWVKSCSPCHGMDGRAATARAAQLWPHPANLVEPAEGRPISPRAELLIIAEGSPGTAMPPWSRALTSAQQQAVYGHLQSLRRGPAKGQDQ
jgi:mono/diheme cytochrome c family protein